jgi:hypothetical protein
LVRLSADGDNQYGLIGVIPNQISAKHFSQRLYYPLVPKQVECVFCDPINNPEFDIAQIISKQSR